MIPSTMNVQIPAGSPPSGGRRTDLEYLERGFGIEGVTTPEYDPGFWDTPAGKVKYEEIQMERFEENTEALRVSTINNAYLTYEEKIKGSIEPDKLADFVILSQDILTVLEEQIRSRQQLATYVGGQKVFSKDGGGF